MTHGVALNRHLSVLHLGMATGITTVGLAAVLSGCGAVLRDLNLAWTDLSEEALAELCGPRGLPADLERLNLSGCRDTLTDRHVELLCER